jgi:catechol 2,3-dioxygenase-like lactoylglutathione lyase family enzyme
MYIDHVGINTNDMEATLQFYCGILGMRLVRTYFHNPNGIRLQIELKTKRDADSLEGDPDPVPYVRALLQRA